LIRSEPFDATLVSARMLTPGVRELVLERVGAPLAFDAGQWVNLLLPLEGGEAKRAYSIASAPTDPPSPRFELAVTRVAGGAGSDYLHALPVGSTLRAIGPQGLFTRAADDPAPALFVATGTGVTPLRAMLHAASRAPLRAPLTLLFGARVEADVLYRDELEALAARDPSFRYEITLSRGDDAWRGRRGWVQAHVPEVLAAVRAESAGAPVHVYVCGLERMVDAVRALARTELAVERKQVHTERYD
jgi:ferredoxin-NADP reductase